MDVPASHAGWLRGSGSDVYHDDDVVTDNTLCGGTMASKERLQVILAQVAIVGAWIALAVFNVGAFFSLGGWVGPADGFLPWSTVAGLLWLPSRRKLGFQPLHRTLAGRVTLAAWWLLIVLGAAGIDERHWSPSPVIVGATYLLLPFFAAFGLAGVLLVRAVRRAAAT